VPNTRLPKVAICALVRNEASYVEEWVNFHRKQGVGEFIIYDNFSRDSTKAEFSRCGIDPADWALNCKSFDEEQRLVYRNARDWLVGRADWVAYIDMDEFLFGRDGETLAQALSKFDTDVSAIAVQQRIFGSSFLEKRYPGNVTDRFTRCAAPGHPEHLWFKTISRPERVHYFDSVHSVVLHEGRYIMADGTDLQRNYIDQYHPEHPGVAGKYVRGGIGLHHYIVKSYEEFLKKAEKWSDRDIGHMRRVENYWNNREFAANTNVCGDLVGFLDDDYSKG